MWVVMYMSMKATLGISLYSYLCLKLAKIHLSYYVSCLFFNKIGEQKGQTGSAQRWGVEGG
jgi:hypothetical protein